MGHYTPYVALYGVGVFDWDMGPEYSGYGEIYFLLPEFYAGRQIE